jgi:hypothetical protein
LCGQATPTGESLLTRQGDMLLKERRGAVAAQTGRLRQEIGNKQRYLQSLYETLVKGIITRGEYNSMKASYEKQITAAMGEIASLESGLKDFEAGASAWADWTDGIRQLRTGTELTAALMGRLVDRIEIGSDKRLAVTYRSEAREVLPCAAM